MNSNSNTEQVRAAMVKAARDAGQHFTASQLSAIPAPLIASALANTSSSDSDEQPDAVKKGAERARHRASNADPFRF